MDHTDDDLLLGMEETSQNVDTTNTATTNGADTAQTNGAADVVVEETNGGGSDNDDDDDSSAGDDDNGAAQVEGNGAAEAAFPEGLGKKEAKKTLSKQQYKLWKKANSSGKKDKKDKKKDKKDKKKSSSSSKKDKNAGRKSGKKRGHDDDEEDINALLAETGEDNYIPDDHEDGMDNSEYQARKKSRRERVTDNIRGLAQEEITDVGGAISRIRHEGVLPKSKLTVAQKKAQREITARHIVSIMAQARLEDKNAILSKQGSPINRLIIKDEVLNIALNSDYEEALVKCGFLNEISFWLLDPVTKGLAPLDLRTAALRILMNVAFKGSLGAVHRRKEKIHKDAVEMDVYCGVCHEDLKENATHLGKAVNFIRQHEGEHPNNRNKACVLLERFSRAWADQPDNAPVRDSFKGTTYEHVTTEVEAFRKTLNRVDPLDPNSYHKVPPLYLRPTPML